MGTRWICAGLVPAWLALAGCGEACEGCQPGDTGVEEDLDGDGYTADQGDCDDADPAVAPGAEDRFGDGRDQNCDGADGVDGDGDGYASRPSGGDDCDDGEAATSPAADEYCDGVDNDCDGEADESDAVDATTWYVDADEDGWGQDLGSFTSCEALPGVVDRGGDCDDTDPTLTPEDGDGDGYSSCDDDCDDGDAGLTPEDADGDGFSSCGGDCDDADPGANPDQEDTFWFDADCDGAAGGGLDLADYRLVGEDREDFAGASVAGAGDVDGDGLGDLLVGASGHDGGGSNAGAAYLILGASLGAPSLGLSLADHRFVGESSGDDAGASVAGAGDVDGDGLGDLLVGAPDDDDGESDAGAAYLVLGASLGPGGDLDLSLADFKFRGERYEDVAGSAVSAAGDLDGDGRGDLLVGAPSVDEAVTPGAAYAILSGL